MNLNGRRGAGGFEVLTHMAAELMDGKPRTFEELPTVRAVQLVGPVTVETEANTVEASGGDYIVEEPGGRLRVVEAAEFEGRYRQVPARRKKAAA